MKALDAISFRPRLFAAAAAYRRGDFVRDLGAGLTVGVVALPLAIAFGIASGVRPEQGLVTAIVAGFLISALGGSRVQIGGPAGAFVALLFGIAEKYGVANLLIATMMAGALLFAMGAFKLGNLVRFVPVSIVIGFTNGIAVIIAVSQVKDLLGLTIAKPQANFFSQLSNIGESLHTTNFYALATGVAALLLVALWPAPAEQASGWRRIAAKLPGTLVVLVVCSALVWWLKLPVETIGSRFGELPRGLPWPQMPDFDWRAAQNLLAPAIAIALLGAIESLLCARVADTLIEDRHDPNQELMAQGIANFVSPLFGGIAATGTIARTVTNVKAGAASPLSGVVHSAFLFAVVLAAAPLAMLIPMPALAAILLWVAYSMGDWREFRRLRQFSLFYRATLLSTFLLTVIFDLVVAIEVGLVLSSLFFIYRISSLTTVERIALSPDQTRLCGGKEIAAYRLFGSLFFGSVTKLEELLDPRKPLPAVVILEMHQVINVDTTGLDALENLHALLLKHGGRLLIAGVNAQPLSLMKRSDFLRRLGEENLLGSLDEALAALSAEP